MWLDYKILAAVAILGLPNSGKSTLLNNLAGIETKVAEYPLTTVEPVVGVVEKRWRQYRLVEIPATWWKRGDDKQRARDSVLKHSERAKVLLICIDSCSESPVEDYASIDGAIRRHGRGLPEKPRIIVVTKVDLSPEASALKGMAESFMPSPHSWHMISCITGQGLEELLKAALDLVEGSSSVEAPQSEARLVTFKPKPRREKAVVEKRGGLFVVRSDQVERLVAGTDLNDWEARAQLAAYMEKVGVQRALEKAGVKRGDTVRIGRAELEWQ
ncbi:MAG: Obg family GTPase CgtA [Dehalococcoidia bacterium]